MMSFPLRGFPSYTVPAVADVRSGTTYDTRTGTLDLPAEGDVKAGVSYDNGTKTGTLDVEGTTVVKGWGTGAGWSR